MSRSSLLVAGWLAAGVVAGCGRTRGMPDNVDLPDSMPVIRAMHDRKAADSMLDTMPGGQMVRGDSAASMRLLRKKR